MNIVLLNVCGIVKFVCMCCVFFVGVNLNRCLNFWLNCDGFV